MTKHFFFLFINYYSRGSEQRSSTDMTNMKTKDPLENEPLINEDEIDAAFEKEIPSTSVLGNLTVAFRYVIAETSKNKRNFLVGVITVFIVVFSVR